MQEVASLFAKVSAQTDSYDRSMRGVRSDLQETQGAMEKFSNFGVAAFKAVAVAAVAIGAGIVAGVGAAVKGAADMEQGVANIGASMQLAAEDTAKLQDYILDLGLDPDLVVDATQASEAIGTLGTAGLDLAQIMNGAAESTILLSNATGGSFAGSAALMTDLMSQFNIKAEDTGRILNQVTGLTVATKFGFEDVAGAFAQVGGVAGALGLSLEDTTAILAVTSSNFASGSDAATSMKTFLQRLVPTTKEASAAMARLNLLNEDGTSKFFDAAGAMKSSEEIASLLQGALGGLSDAQRIEAASTIFGTDAMRTAFGLMEGGQSAIMDAKKLIGDTNAQEMATKRMDTLSGAWQIFRGVIDTVSLGIGEKFLPAVRKAVEWLTDLAQTWGPRVIDFFGVLADRMTSAFDSVGAAIGTFRSLFSLQLATITSDNASWGERMVAIWDIVASLGNTLWQRLAAALPMWIEQLGEWARAAWQWLVDSIPTALQKLGEWAAALWQWIVTNLPTWISNLGAWAVAAWQWIVDMTPIAIEKLTALRDALVQNITTWASSMGPVVSGLWNTLVSLFIAGGQLMQGNWANAWENLKNAATTAWTTLSMATKGWGSAIWQWIVDAIPVVRTKLAEWGAAIWQWLLNNGPSWLRPLAEWAVLAWQWVVDATQPLRNALGELWKPIEWFIGMFRLHWALMDVTNASVGDRLMSVWYLLRNVVGVVFSAIGEWLDTSIGSWLKWSDIVIGAVLALAIFLAPTIGAALMSAMVAIATFIAGAGALLLLFASIVAAVALVRIAWENDWGGIRTFTLDALKVLGDAFGPLLTTIQEFGGQALKEIWAWVTGNDTNFEAVKKIWEAAKTAFGKVFDAIVAKLVEWGNAAREWFEKHFPGASKKLIEAIDKIKANFKQLWDALEPLIQKMKDEFDRYRENWEKNSGKVGSALEKLQKFIDGILTIMATAIGLFVSNAINFLTLIIQFINGDWAGAWETIKEIGQDTWDAVVKIVGTAVDTILGIFGLSLSDIQDWLDRTGVILQSWMGSFTGWLTGLRDSALTKMQELRDNVMNPVNAFVDATKTKVGEWKDWLVQKYVDLRDSIKEKMDAFRDNVINPIREFVEDTKTKVGEWKDWLIQKYIDIRDGIKEKMDAFKANVIDPIAEFVTTTKEKILEWKGWLVQKYIDIRDAVKEKMDAFKANVIDPIVEFVTTTKEKILVWKEWLVAKWVEIRDKVKEKMDEVKTNVIDPIVAFVATTKEKISGWKDWIIEKYTALRDDIQNRLNWFKDKFIEPITTFVTQTKQKITEWKDWFIEKFNAIKDWFKPGEWLQKGRDIIQGLWDGLTEKWENLSQWFSGVWGTLVGDFKSFFGIASPSTLFASFGESMMQGLQGGIQSAAQLPLNAMDSLASQVQTKVSSMTTAVANSAQTIRDTINNMPALPEGYWSSPVVPQPPAPTVPAPVVPPPPVPVETPVVQHGSVEFGFKNLAAGLNLLAGFVDTSDTIAEIQKFAGKAQAFLTAPGQPQLQGSSAAHMALQSLQSGGVDTLSVNNLLGMIQTLISKLDERGFGQQFNIQQAPDATLQQQTELEELVAYLNALYA